MDIQHLQIIQYTAICEFNLTKAAQTLHTSQPGISRQIRELEEELGVTIFIRSGKRLTGLTEPGKAVLNLACRIMADVRHIQTIPSRFGKTDTGLLRVTTDSTGIACVPRTFTRFNELYPKVRVACRQQEAMNIASALLHDEADIALAGSRLRVSRDIVTFPCAVMQYKVVVAKSHPLARRAPLLTLDSLLAYPLMTYSADKEERLQVSNAFAGAKMTPNIVLTADAACLIKCARLGMGVAIVCAEGADIAEQKQGIFMRDAGHLFEGAPLLLGIRRGKLLRDFERQYIQILLPDIDTDVIQQAVLNKNPEQFIPDFSI
ncbi:CysB family transcriptional regulator [Deltaproteobacteria bacterium]|nr:CysB family transcriptional regulator [Deltaproteobacteria bacterium]